jgi:hypothetical protein
MAPMAFFQSYPRRLDDGNIRKSTFGLNITESELRYISAVPIPGDRRQSLSHTELDATLQFTARSQDMSGAADRIWDTLRMGRRWICRRFCGILEDMAQRFVHLYEVTLREHESNHFASLSSAITIWIRVLYILDIGYGSDKELTFLGLLFERTPRISYRGGLHDYSQYNDRICSYFGSSA